MQTSVNSTSLERHIDLAVPVELFNREVGKRLQKLSRTVKLHGFRPGKVPLRVVAQQFGREVEQEVLEEELKARFADAIRDKELKVAGYPRFESKERAEASEELLFDAKFEVYPEISLGDLGGVSIERPVFEVGEAEIERTIENLRKQRAVFEPVDRAVESGDKVDLDYEGKIDGFAFDGGAAKGLVVVLGQGTMVEGFESAVIGMKAGETKSAEVTFPEDYHGKEVAGKTAVFEIVLNRVEAPRMPEFDAEFARNLGVDSGDVEEVRKEIAENLGREVKRRIRARTKDHVMQALLDTSSLELPNSLVEMESYRLMEMAKQDFESRGMNVKNMPFSPDFFREQAQKRVRLGLILAELVKEHELHAKPEQVRAIVEDFAQSYEHPEEFVNWHYAEPSRLADAESLALEDNVVSWALGVAKVEDKSLTFDELMGI